MTPQEREALEGLIDRHSLTAVLELLAEICSDKADHIRTNWQYHPTAACWERAAVELVRILDLTDRV